MSPLDCVYPGKCATEITENVVSTEAAAISFRTSSPRVLFVVVTSAVAAVIDELLRRDAQRTKRRDVSTRCDAHAGSGRNCEAGIREK